MPDWLWWGMAIPVGFVCGLTIVCFVMDGVSRHMANRRCKTPRDHDKLVQLIAMRFRVSDQQLPFDFIAAHATDSKATVVIVCGENSVLIEDDPGLFPSDALITQLRLLAKK